MISNVYIAQVGDGTCAVEGGHVVHGFLVGLFDLFLRYDQLDLVPFVRLQEKGNKKKFTHTIPGESSTHPQTHTLHRIPLKAL